MTTHRFDVIVIGSGPAGEATAMHAVKSGKRVAMIETQPMVGGNCTHKGTIPSKALRYQVRKIMQFNKNALFRDIAEPRVFEFSKVMDTVNTVIEKEVKTRSEIYARNRVQVFFGDATFVDSHSVRVTDADGAVDVLTGRKFMIATGSRPYRPPFVDFNHSRVFDSDTILKLKDTPRSLIIYGAGVIGCEYASIFSGLGVKVDLIDTRDRLLSFLDDEISGALSYHLREYGVLVRHNEECEKVHTYDDHIVMEMASGKRVRADMLLWCNGRSGNTDEMGLDAVGLEPNHRGQLEVASTYQTAVDHIYAAGDVIGWPSLAGAAYDQGRSAAAHMCGVSEPHHVTDVATGIYTIPEISSVGKTERELTDARVPYEVGRAMFKNISRAHITGDTAGMLKILFHSETLEVLGVHCFGAEASEIIHIGQAIMNQPSGNNTLKYFLDTTFNYPTMAEAYRKAALDGINRVSR